MKKTYVKKFTVFTTIQHGFWLLSEVTIKQAKKNVRWIVKIVKIEEIFMFYHLNHGNHGKLVIIHIEC